MFKKNLIHMLVMFTLQSRVG